MIHSGQFREQGARVMLGWLTRAALMKPSSGSDQDGANELVQTLDTGGYARHAVNDVLFSFALHDNHEVDGNLSVHELRCIASRTADTIQGADSKSRARLRKALAKCQRKPTRVAAFSIVDEIGADAEQLLAHGESIAQALLLHVAENPNGILADRLQQVQYAPPFAWGATFSSMQSPQEVIECLQTAPECDLAAALLQLGAHGQNWLSIESARRFRKTGLNEQTADPQGQLRKIIRDPQSTDLLVKAADRQSLGFEPFFEVPALRLRALIIERQRSAAAWVNRIHSNVERVLGPTLTRRLFGRLNLAAEVDRIAALEATASDKDMTPNDRVNNAFSTEGLRTRAESLLAIITQEASRVRGEQLLRELESDFRWAPLRKQLSLNRGARGVGREVMATIVQHALSELGASGDPYSILKELATRSVRKRVQAKILDALANGPEYLGDILSYRDAVALTNVCIRKSERAAQTRSAERENHVFRISSEAKLQMEAEAARCYPSEAMGLLVDLGPSTVFVPMKNRLHGTIAGETRGEQELKQRSAIFELIDRLGLSMCAMFHSHPDEQPLFSRQDLSANRGNVAAKLGTRSYIVSCSRRDNSHSFTHACFETTTEGDCNSEDTIDVAPY